MPWLSVNTEYSIHRVQHTLGTAYTKYCIHWVLHHRIISCPQPPASLSARSGPCWTQFSTFPQLWICQWNESQPASHMPPDLPPPDSLALDWLPPDWPPSHQLPPDQPPPCTPPIVIDHGLKIWLLTRSITASNCISEFTRSQPPRASPNSVKHDLPVHLWVQSISQSLSASPNSLDPGLQALLSVQSISVSQSISKHAQSRPQVHLQRARVVVRRCRGNGGVQSDGEYIFGSPWSR